MLKKATAGQTTQSLLNKYSLDSFVSSGGGGDSSVKGWIELDRTTLGSTANSITVSGLADKKYYMILFDVVPSGAAASAFQLGSGSIDTANNYAYRYSIVGGSDVTAINQPDSGDQGFGGVTLPTFDVAYIGNTSDAEKLILSQRVGQNTAGKGTAPVRSELVWKWVNTSNPLDVVNGFKDSGAGTFSSGSELVVLGWSPNDEHTSNFWQELSSTNLSGGVADTLTSDVMTSKKYIWFQAYLEGTGGAVSARFRLGNDTIDTADNYAYRSSIDGGSENVQNTQTSIYAFDGTNPEMFVNAFIINKSANEKIMTGDVVISDTAGSAAAPSCSEFVGKWANTSAQMNILQMYNNGAGSYGTNSILKVWGHD